VKDHLLLVGEAGNFAYKAHQLVLGPGNHLGENCLIGLLFPVILSANCGNDLDETLKDPWMLTKLGCVHFEEVHQFLLGGKLTFQGGLELTHHGKKELAKGFADYPFLGAEVVVYGSHIHPRPRGDIAHGKGINAGNTDDLERGENDALFGRFSKGLFLPSLIVLLCEIPLFSALVS
jgi:hypothetical protein